MVRRKVFFRYLFSYILVLILPITIISYFIYFQFIEEFKAEVMGSATKILQQTKDATDAYLESFDRLTSNLATNRHISFLLSQDSVQSLDPYPYYLNAIKELDKYKNANPIIQNIFIIFSEQDVVISNSSKYDLKTFKDYVFKLNDFTRQDFVELLGEVNGKAVLTFNNVIYNDRRTNVVCYINALPINSTAPRAMLVITVNQQDLKQPMENFLGKYEGYAYVLDDNNIIMDSKFNDFRLDDEKRRALLSAIEGQEGDSYSISVDEYVISFIRSDKNGWRYVSIIPSYNILSKINSVQQRLIEIIILTFLIGMLIILYFSSKDSRKIYRIINSIKNYDKDSIVDSSEYRSEWDLINKTIVNYVIKNRDLSKKIYQQMPIIKNSFFRNLINGSISDENSIDNMLQFLGLDLKKQHYGVLVIEADISENGKINTIKRDNNLQQNKPIKEVILTALTDIIQNVVDNEDFVYVVEDQKLALDVIVGIDSDNHMDNSQYLFEIAQQIKEVVRKNLGFTVTIGIGGLYDNLLELNNSYNEASKALEYKILMGCDSIIIYDEICRRSEKGICYSFEQQKRLINFIKMGAYEDIQKILDEIVYTIKSKPLDLVSIKCIYFDIINTAMKAADEINIENSNSEIFMEKLSQMETLDQIYSSVSEFYRTLCIQIAEAKLSKNTELAEKVIEYINSNYMDSMLSVASIAEHFSVSSSYLSRYMKDYLGYSVTDYIHEVRLKEAKYLLKNTDKTVATIAEEVGYNSLHNFTRVFKRYEGITPTNYRVV